MRRLTYVTTLGLSIAGFLAIGCTPNKIESRPSSNMGIAVSASSTKVNVNETVTFTLTDENTLGRNAKVSWEKTGGKLWTTDDTQRIAQVVFDTPGVYSVTAVLTSSDGRVIERESRTIEVKPLPR